MRLKQAILTLSISILLTTSVSAISSKQASASVVLTPNGKVAGYKDLKFGITRDMAKSILEKNCSSDSIIDESIWLQKNNCFNVMTKAIGIVKVGFESGKLASVHLDFNANVLHDPTTQNLKLLFGNQQLASYNHFNGGSFEKIKKNVDSKYNLTEVNNDFHGFKIFSYEHGAILLVYKSKWNSSFQEEDFWFGIDYYNKDNAKKILKTYRLGEDHQDEF